LVSNAIKFTDRGGVTVRLRRLRVRHRCVVELEVADTGIGMEEGRLDEAFAPFMQLSSSSTREHRGLGLGLALVRRNVISLGATLDVRSKPSAGSSFRVRFPEAPQA
jgi:signal transduction histidine kinase